MDTAAMAAVLIDVDHIKGRDSFSPANVSSAIANFTGWSGDKMALNWRGILVWHTHSCSRRCCVPASTMQTNIHRCPTLRVLLDMATSGIRPALWMKDGDDSPPEAPIRQPYSLSSQEQEVARLKHADFEEAGVVRRVAKRAVRRDEKHGSFASSSFVVVKWKAIRTAVASERRAAWAETDAVTVQKFLAGDKRVEPPTDAYKPKWRVVYDLKHLNLQTLKLPMTYGYDTEAWAKVSPGSTLAVLDVKDGFTAIPIAPSNTQLFNILTDGQDPVQLQRMPFGYRLAPFFFCLYSAALADAMAAAHPEVLTVHMYMDDALLVLNPATKNDLQAGTDDGQKRTRLATAQDTVTHCIDIMAACGAKVSTEKIEGPATSVDYLGLRVSATQQQVELQLPAAKWFTLTQLTKLATAVMRGPTPSLPRGAIDSLVGKLQALSNVVPLLKADLGTIYSLKRAKTRGRFWAERHKMDAVALAPKHTAALQRLFGHIASFTSRNLYSAPTTASWPTIFGAVDASGEGGLGGHLRVVGSKLQTSWSTRISGAQQGDEWVGMSTYLELLAIEEAVKQANKMIQNDWKRLVVAVDSQAAAAIVRKGYSTRSAEANTICKRIEAKIWGTKTILSVFWIPRRFNWRADLLSHPGGMQDKLRAQEMPEEINDLTANLPRGAWESPDRTPAHAQHTESLRSPKHSSLDPNGETKTQHDRLEPSSGTGVIHEKGLPVSNPSVHRSTGRASTPETEPAHSLRIQAGELRQMGCTRSRQIPHQDTFRPSMAWHPGTEPEKGHEDELAAESAQQTATISGHKAQKGHLNREAHICSQIPETCAASNFSQGSQSSAPAGILRHAAIKRISPSICKKPGMVVEQKRAADLQESICRQNSPVKRQEGTRSSEQWLGAGSLSADSSSEGEADTARSPDSRAKREGGDQERLEESEVKPRLHQAGREHVLATAGSQQSTDTQARGVGTELEHPEQTLHLHEQMGTATAAKGIVGHNVLGAGH